MIRNKGLTATSDLAERCKIALEKSYGSDIPLPECLQKRKLTFK